MVSEGRSAEAASRASGPTLNLLATLLRFPRLSWQAAGLDVPGAHSLDLVRESIFASLLTERRWSTGHSSSEGRFDARGTPLALRLPGYPDPPRRNPIGRSDETCDRISCWSPADRPAHGDGISELFSKRHPSGGEGRELWLQARVWQGKPALRRGERRPW